MVTGFTCVIQQSGDKMDSQHCCGFCSLSLRPESHSCLSGDRERAESGFPETGLRVRGGWRAKENRLTVSHVVISLVRLENGLTMSHRW